MRVFAVFTLVAVCACLVVEAKYLRRKRELSEKLLNELDRELKNFLNRRDDGATQTQDAVHACEQGMTDEIKNKMKNRGQELIGAVTEMGKEIYFTAVLFSGFESQNGVLDLETGFTHVLHFLGSLGVVAHTPRGEEYVGRLVKDTRYIAKISIDNPKEANAIMKIAVDEVTGYLSENFPPPQDVNVPSKRGDTLPQGTEQDMALEGIFHVICSFNRQSWKQVVTDFDQVIDEGLWVVRNTSSLLRSIRVIVALEGAERWGEMTVKGLGYLAKITYEGDDAKIKKAFDHAQAIRERVEKAIAAYQNSQNTDQSGGSKRVLHGLSKDDLKQFLNTALKLYQSRRK